MQIILKFPGGEPQTPLYASAFQFCPGINSDSGWAIFVLQQMAYLRVGLVGPRPSTTLMEVHTQANSGNNNNLPFLYCNTPAVSCLRLPSFSKADMALLQETMMTDFAVLRV